MTLKNVAAVCLVAVLVLAMVAPLLGLHTATSDTAGAAGHNSRVLLDDIPTPTPTPGAGTDSNPSGGGDGG